MNAQDIEVFTHGILRYFAEVSGAQAEVGAPFLKGKDTVILDYTGAIGISGDRKGGVYFTAGRRALEDLVQAVVGVEADEDALKDMAGEIANTIAGNARESFGSNFMISIPMVVVGMPNTIEMPTRVPTYVIPIVWKDHKAFLVVGIE